MKPNRLLRLKVASTFDNLEDVVGRVQAFMEAHKIGEDLAYNVVLLASEAVTNAMEHGNEWDPEKHIVLEVDTGPEIIEMTVTDEGPGFDLSLVGDPIETENLLKGRGRGLYFMELMADEFHIEEEGRQLRLVFRRE